MSIQPVPSRPRRPPRSRLLSRVLLSEHAREREAWERERWRLIEMICDLAGRPLRAGLASEAVTEVLEPGRAP